MLLSFLVLRRQCWSRQHKQGQDDSFMKFDSVCQTQIMQSKIKILHAFHFLPTHASQVSFCVLWTRGPRFWPWLPPYVMFGLHLTLGSSLRICIPTNSSLIEIVKGMARMRSLRPCWRTLVNVAFQRGTMAISRHLTSTLLIHLEQINQLFWIPEIICSTRDSKMKIRHDGSCRCGRIQVESAEAHGNRFT